MQWAASSLRAGQTVADCVLALCCLPFWTSFFSSILAVGASAYLVHALHLEGRFLIQVSPLDLESWELLGTKVTWWNMSFESQCQAKVILGIKEEFLLPRESFRDGWSRVSLGNKRAECLLAFPRPLQSSAAWQLNKRRDLPHSLGCTGSGAGNSPAVRRVLNSLAC